MTVLTNIKAILEADATLLALATGGIYDLSETGRLGLNSTTVPGAYDATTGLIKPCILLKLRSETPDGILQDDSAQYSSLVAVYEAWCYEDSGFTTIDAMQARIYALLHAVQVPGTFQVFWAGDGQPIWDEAMDANTGRSDYTATVKRAAA